MGRPAIGYDCIDPQTVAQCDIQCLSKVGRDCRVWGGPKRPLVKRIEIWEDEYRALLQLAGACRSDRMVGVYDMSPEVSTALEALDKVQANG